MSLMVLLPGMVVGGVFLRIRDATDLMLWEG